MFERILIATDGSKHSERAAEAGIEMAKLYGSAVTALFVVDIGKEYAPLGDLISKVADDLIAGIRSNLQNQGDAGHQESRRDGRKGRHCRDQKDHGGLSRRGHHPHRKRR